MAESLAENVGFIGLGLMGTPMLQNLIKKMEPKTKFFLYDVVQDPMLRVQQEHGLDKIHICQSPKEVAEKSDTILTMVPEGSHVRTVYLHPRTGLLSTPLHSKTLLDCSTIDTATSSSVLTALQTTHPHATFHDAPVSGGVKGAELGSLTFMLGIAPSAPSFPAIHALLSLMGKNIFACGGPGLGLVAKQANNYCSGMIAIAVSEAMGIGMRSGMDPRVLANVFHTSTAQSAILDDWSPVPGLLRDAPSSRDYQGGFKIELMKKDLGLAVDTAERVGAKLALGKVGYDVYEQASKDPRCQGRDSRVVYRFLGGDEEWKEKHREDVPLRSQDTKALLKWAREQRQEEPK